MRGTNTRREIVKPVSLEYQYACQSQSSHYGNVKFFEIQANSCKYHFCSSELYSRNSSRACLFHDLIRAVRQCHAGRHPIWQDDNLSWSCNYLAVTIRCHFLLGSIDPEKQGCCKQKSRQ